MEITQEHPLGREQFAKIEKYLPKQHGHISINNYELVLALLYVVENGCRWRALPERYGRSVYTLAGTLYADEQVEQKRSFNPPF